MDTKLSLSCKEWLEKKYPEISEGSEEKKDCFCSSFDLPADMNYGYPTPDFSEADIPLDEGIDYEGDLSSNLEEFRSNSAISTQSLCSALGSHMEIRAKSMCLLCDFIVPVTPHRVTLT